MSTELPFSTNTRRMVKLAIDNVTIRGSSWGCCIPLRHSVKVIVWAETLGDFSDLSNVHTSPLDICRARIGFSQCVGKAPSDISPGNVLNLSLGSRILNWSRHVPLIFWLRVLRFRLSFMQFPFLYHLFYQSPQLVAIFYVMLVLLMVLEIFVGSKLVGGVAKFNGPLKA